VVQELAGMNDGGARHTTGIMPEMDKTAYLGMVRSSAKPPARLNRAK
jgi:hypothetical protein